MARAWASTAGHLVTTGDAAGNSLGQTIRSLRIRVFEIVSAGKRFRQIRESDMQALPVRRAACTYLPAGPVRAPSSGPSRWPTTYQDKPCRDFRRLVRHSTGKRVCSAWRSNSPPLIFILSNSSVRFSMTSKVDRRGAACLDYGHGSSLAPTRRRSIPQCR